MNRNEDGLSMALSVGVGTLLLILLLGFAGFFLFRGAAVVVPTAPASAPRVPSAPASPALLAGEASVTTAAPTGELAGPGVDELAAIEAMVEALYEAFDFDAGGEADWDGMRALFAEGASFASPATPDRPARSVDAESFLADFQAWVADSEEGRTGFYERITHLEIEVYGGIAQVLVTFEGYVPPDGPALTLGLDALQLVKDEGEWRLAAFATQYASESLPMPARFLPD